jgi:hypothetical protein
MKLRPVLSETSRPISREDILDILREAGVFGSELSKADTMRIGRLFRHCKRTHRGKKPYYDVRYFNKVA